MSKIILRLAVLSSPLLLGACGEGWEMQRTDQIAPYGNQRTAGTGIAYVRAKMLPKKELLVEAPLEETQAPLIENDTVLDAEEIFTEQQIKGASPSKSENNIIDNNSEEELEEEIGDAFDEFDEEVEEVEDHSSNTLGAPKNSNGENQSAQIDVLEIKPLAMTDIDMDITEEEFSIALDNDNTIEVYESQTSQPLKQIIVPKQDVVDLRTKGEISLDEIYNDDFINSF